MKIIYNKIIPFKGYKLMNILGLVFSRVKKRDITLVEQRHEQYHTLQQYEILMVAAIVSLILCNIYSSWWYLIGTILLPFIVYVSCWIFEIILPPYHSAKSLSKLLNDAYHDNCFEREAYMNEKNSNYFITRPLFGWVRYILKKR